MKAIVLTSALLFFAITISAAPFAFPQAPCDGCALEGASNGTNTLDTSSEIATGLVKRETESEDLRCDGCAVTTEAVTAVPTGLVERAIGERESESEDLKCDGCAITTGTAMALPAVNDLLANTSSTTLPATETSGSLEERCDGCAVVNGTPTQKL